MISQFSGAVFDQKRAYRFILWRFWSDAPRVLFVGLNPSTADEYGDDHTVRRCLDFAGKWGYGGLYFCNLFSYVTKSPEVLSGTEAIHAANIPAITMATQLVVLTVAAWGDGIEVVKNGKTIAEHIKKIIAPALCFGLTQKGNPKHPLYLNSEQELVDFN